MEPTGPEANATPSPFAPEHFANILAAVRDPQHPGQIGPYHIEGLIGEGGMGSVYKAEQHEPISRVVAIKIIKLGMDTREVIARFESERQALAVMDHPNVARVIDAGATENGRPYFVMDYVDGEPITSFCDHQNYTVRQRLELFTQACEAVQHAHQKAIIHRDLKPSNILVSLQDGKPWVKVIDFGVAKALSQRLTEKSLFTQTGQLIGTPEYMAPEQAEGNLMDVDTRTDVYSLGVVLYELLIGALPFDSKTLRSHGYVEIQRIIREVDPPRPSTRLTSLGKLAQDIAKMRQTQLLTLQQQLRSELEWIPLKAMRKEREHRYASPRELSEDIANYLSQHPLRAGPESRVYRARKFLRRNKLGVAASTAMLLLLLAGIGATTWQAVRATRAERRASGERDNAQATLEFLTNDVLAGATPERIPDNAVREQIVAAMITPAANLVGERFHGRPIIEANIRETIRSVLVKIGRRDLALPHAEAALVIRRRELGDNHLDTLTSLNNLASVLEKLGRVSEAEKLYRDSLARRRQVFGEDHPKTLMAMNNHAHALYLLGRYAEAEPIYKTTLELRRRVLGPDDPDTIMSVNNYASVLESLDRNEEAAGLYKQALDSYRRLLGDDHPQTMTALSNYANGLQSLDRLTESEAIFKEVLERRRRVLGDNHSDTMFSMDQYAIVLHRLGRFVESEKYGTEALERRRRILGEDHPYTIWSLNDSAVALNSLGRFVEAESQARQAVTKAAANSSLGPQHPLTKTSAETHSKCLESLGRHDEAAAVRRQFGLPDPATRAASKPATGPTR